MNAAVICYLSSIISFYSIIIERKELPAFRTYHPVFNFMLQALHQLLKSCMNISPKVKFAYDQISTDIPSAV